MEFTADAVRQHILFTMPHGSRLYGLENENSDYDYKSIYLPPLEHIICGKAPKTFNTKEMQTIEGKLTKVEIELIPLQKFMQDFFAGQTYALEVAFSLDHPQADIFDDRFVSATEYMRLYYLTSNIKSMVGYALNQAMVYGVKGERLNVITRVREFLDEYFEKYPNGKNALVNDIIDVLCKVGDNNKYIFKTYSVLNGVERPALQVLGKVHHGTITVGQLYLRLENMEQEYGGRARTAMEDKGVDWKALSHALRVIDEANELLTQKRLTFPFTGVQKQKLLDAKHAVMSFDEISALLAAGLQLIEDNKLTTELPAANPELQKRFEVWQTRTIMNMYHLNYKDLG